MLRDLLSLSDLLKHLLAPSLPLVLRMGYLMVFTEGYLISDRPSRGLLVARELPLILEHLKRDLANRSLYLVDSASQPNGREYIFQQVVPTVSAFIRELWGPRVEQMRREEETGRTSERPREIDTKYETDDHFGQVSALISDLVRLVLEIAPVSHNACVIARQRPMEL